ncbi:MAG: hypothetical protein PHY43_11255 [Verrucomicrobiales bacterium]|nr:hypothetical protein [Verrucomicrobiales bacterium]
MNPETTGKPVWYFGINFVVACLLFVALVVVVKFSVSVPAIDADRAAVRTKALAEIRAAEATALNTAGWVDQDRGIVRLPIATALQLSESAARNPAAARADLIARAEKAAAPLPKTVPKPSAFE